MPGAADKGGAGTPEAAVSGSQTERQAVAAGGSQEGKQGVDGVKALKEQEAVMQSSVQRARERNVSPSLIVSHSCPQLSVVGVVI